MSDSLWPADDGQWQPWEMTPLGGTPQAQADLSLARSELLRKQAFQRKVELQALREKTRDEALQQGRDEGFAQGKEEGYAAGLEEGRRAGELELQQQTLQAVQPLLQLCQTFDQALKQLDQEIAAQLVDLALSTARQLAGDALTAQPEQILSIVQDLLHSEPSLTGKPRLWLHPADLALVKARLDDQLNSAGWTVQADPALSRGGCRVASASAELDASREARWASISRVAGQSLGQDLPEAEPQP